jgi:hypothetical protein
VHVQSQESERSCIYVLGVSNLPVFIIFIFDFVVVCRRAHVLFTLFVVVCRRAHVLFTLFVVVCRRAHVLFTLFVFVYV